MTAMTAPVTNKPATATQTDLPRGMTEGAVRAWLRIEGLAAFGLGLVLFGINGGAWVLLVPLLLVPDLFAAGYLLGRPVGTFTYNLVHNWAPGFVLLAVGLWLGSAEVQLASAILIAHVGMDRAVGYGLKLPTSFQDTHLGRMGRAKA